MRPCRRIRHGRTARSFAVGSAATRLAVVMVAASCAAPESAVGRDWLNERLSEAAGNDAGALPKADEMRVPAGVVLEDGLDGEEAVALALFNNPNLEAALARLDVSRADLQQAGLLGNPVLALLFPLGPKQLEATLNVPVDALWKRRRRIAVASIALESVGEDLVREGLLVARNARAAYVRAVHARELAELLRELAALRDRRAAFEQARVDAGDSEPGRLAALTLERERAALDALEAESLSGRALLDLGQALGIAAQSWTLSDSLESSGSAGVAATLARPERLVERASARRPPGPAGRGVARRRGGRTRGGHARRGARDRTFLPATTRKCSANTLPSGPHARACFPWPRSP